MKPLRFLHAADLHLDSPFKGMTALPDALRERLRESTFHALQELVRVALAEQVDFVVISGDVYDLADRSLRAQIRFRQAMETLAARGIPAYIIHGNHDPEDGRAAKLAWPAAVHFFASDRVETLVVDKPGRGVIAHIHGISYRTAAVTDNLALQYRAGDPSVYQIGLLHTNVDGDPSHGNYAPCSRHDLAQSGMHYWALGHVHTRRVLQEQRPAIVYPGNLQGRSIRERGPKGCYVVSVNEVGEAKLSFHATDRVRWFQETVSIQGMQTEQELQDGLEQRLEQIRAAAEGRLSIVRFVLEGRGVVHRLLRQGKAINELLAELREQELVRLRSGVAAAGSLGADDLLEDPPVWIESITDRTGLEIDREALLLQRGFLSDLLRRSQELQRDEQALQDFAREALAALGANPQAAGLLPAPEPALLREWLRAAEDLAADALVQDRGWDG